MPTVNLVPLGIGELLDKTFSTFRKNFWLFTGIMILPQAIMAGIGILLQVYMSGFAMVRNPKTHQMTYESTAVGVKVALAALGSVIPHYIVYALALGATTYALSEVYLGHSTTIRECYRVVYRKVWRLLLVIFSVLLRCFGLFILSVMLITLVVAGISPIMKVMPWIAIVAIILALLGFIASAILVVIFVMRYSVAVPAVVLENLRTRQALKRSVALTKGFLWRLLVVGGLMMLISMTIVSLCQAPFSIAAMLISVKGGRPSLWLTIPSLLLGSTGAIVTTPLLMISFAIAYYDLRVRKEGFDLQLMMSNLEPAPGGLDLNPSQPQPLFDDVSVLGVVFLTLITSGIYQPIWFMLRRKAFNSLRSREKLGIIPLSLALLAVIATLAIPIVGKFKWGTVVEAENVLFPINTALFLLAAIIMIVQCFKVRRMLLDHLAPQQEGMFSSSIRFQNDELFSRTGTFFLGIFYLQHKINGLIDRLTVSTESHVEELLPTVTPSPIQTIIS